MTNKEALRRALKIDDNAFQRAAAEAEPKIKRCLLELMSDAENETEEKAIMSALCAVYASMLILYKPDGMESLAALDSGAKGLMLTGMQMLDYDEEHLISPTCGSE